VHVQVGQDLGSCRRHPADRPAAGGDPPVLVLDPVGDRVEAPLGDPGTRLLDQLSAQGRVVQRPRRGSSGERRLVGPTTAQPAARASQARSGSPSGMATKTAAAARASARAAASPGRSACTRPRAGAGR
jgi:hypothetical protein